MARTIPLPKEIKNYKYSFIETDDLNVGVWVDEGILAQNYIKLIYDSYRLMRENKLYVYVFHGEQKGNIGRVVNMKWETAFFVRKIAGFYSTNEPCYLTSNKETESIFNSTDPELLVVKKKYVTHKHFKISLFGYDKAQTINPKNMVILHGYDGGEKNLSVEDDILTHDFLGNEIRIGDLVIIGTNDYERGLAFGTAESCTNKTIQFNVFKIKDGFYRQKIRLSRHSSSFVKLDENLKKRLVFKRLQS